ncbi:MAG: hypothetical protein ACI8YQ_002784 [Polaribacter sp.]|jgi:hypothetical protein
MRKIIPLIFSVFLSVSLSGQADGGWGNCEFATVATMNAFDPSGDSFTCKKVFVQATDEHYRWDGTTWALESSGVENIYNTSDTLTADRTVTLDGSDLTFDGTGIGNGDVIIEADGDVGIGTTTPIGQLNAVNTENVDAFTFSNSNGSTGEKDVFTIIDSDVGGGDQDHSSALKVLKNASINPSDFGYSLVELTYTGTDPTDDKYWISGRKTDEGAPEWGVNISDNRIWSSGGLLLNASGAANGTYSGGNFIVESGGDVGVGTTTPDARLDVEGGNVRFSDYGGGTYLDVADTLVLADATYALAVDTNGDVVEVNTAKSSKIFYPPALVINVSSIGDNRILDLHKQYVTLYGTPAIVSSGAPAAIPTYGETELFYYVTDYDTDVFSDLEISADGILTYDVDVIPTNNCAAFNVIFVVK